MQLSLWFEVEDISPDTQAAMDVLVQDVCQSVGRAIDMQLDQENYHVILASDNLIQQLNRDFRKKDTLTDVLSFPLGREEEITGEVYLCWSRIISQAEEYGHKWQREFCYLLVHGILHLLGYEHGDEPCPEMRDMEEKVLQLMELGR